MQKLKKIPQSASSDREGIRSEKRLPNGALSPEKDDHREQTDPRCRNSSMARLALWPILLLSLLPLNANPQTPGPAQDPITLVLRSNQYDLHTSGLEFLSAEADKNSFFMLGELHGDDQVPQLLQFLWPRIWKSGYRHIAAEISPWVAHQLEFGTSARARKVKGLWTVEQAQLAHAAAPSDFAVLWGCDMEEIQPQELILRLASLNASNPRLQAMARSVSAGYTRAMAPALLNEVKAIGSLHDETVNDISLRDNLIATLEIDMNRSSPVSRMVAQNERELLMKRQFLTHYRAKEGSGKGGKVLLRFGRNHLHRGYDSRGISTLGNFVAEFALAHGDTVFNVGAFGAGGTASLLGETWNADERADEPTFAFLASRAQWPATVFDLRPLRPILHQIPPEKRTALQTNLVYWADSYDVLICYRIVTPLQPNH